MPTHNHGATTANGGHSHNRGSMDITGTMQNSGLAGAGAGYYSHATGVFYHFTPSYNQSWAGATQQQNTDNKFTIGFQASRNWVGVTSTVDNHQHTTQDAGSGQSHNNMQPYLAVAIWKRTA